MAARSRRGTSPAPRRTRPTRSRSRRKGRAVSRVVKLKSPQNLADLVHLADAQSWPQLSAENQRVVINCIHNVIMQKFRKLGRRPIMGVSARSTAKGGLPSVSVLEEVGAQLGELQQQMISLNDRLRGMPHSSARDRLMDDQRRIGNLIEYYYNAQAAIQRFQESRHG